MPYNLVLFAVLLIAASFLLGQLTAGQDVKIIKDLGLAATAVFGLFIAIFIGIGLVSKEVERRSIYALLAKPVSRPQFIVGKYAGLVLTLAVNVAVMTLALYVVLGYMTWTDAAPSPRRPGTRRASIRALLKAIVPDLRRADARHRARAVLLDLLDADPVRGADVRPLRRRALQRRPEELRAASSTRSRRSGSRAASITCCRTSRPSTSRPRSCTACRWRPATSLRPRATASPTSRPPARRDGADLLAAGLQVTARAAALRAALALAVAGRLAPPSALQIGARSRLSARAGARDRAAALRPVAAPALKRLALDFDALAADVYWIRALQHYGGDRLGRATAAASTSCCIRCSI